MASYGARNHHFPDANRETDQLCYLCNSYITCKCWSCEARQVHCNVDSDYNVETRIPSLRPVNLAKRRDAKRHVENEIGEFVRL